MAAGNWLVETDTKVTLRGLKDELGAFVNDATVTGDLYDKTVVVDNGSNIPFTYVDGSDGDYEGVIPANVPIKEGSSYDLFLTAVRSGKMMVVRVRRTAKYLDV
jgi:hypothetical protein